MLARIHAKIVPFLALSALAFAVVLPGCGGEDPMELGQEFEKPATPPPVVQDPPDTGEDIHPRDR